MFIKSALCCTQSSLPTPCETYHDYKWKYQLTKISKLTLNRTSDQVKWTSSSVTFVILDSLHEICSVGKRTGEQLVCVHLKINWRNQYYKCLTAYIHTAISRKVVGKNVHTTTPKGNMGYNQYTVSTNCSCQTYFCCFSSALVSIRPWPLVPFFQISLENRADKTTHNTFQDCRVHFFRRFSKQLYTCNV